MKIIADAYCRNSDKYVLLEKRKKRENGGNSSADIVSTDAKFTTMVNMMSCLVLAFPYDLPSFLPQLVSCLVRHKNSQSLKDAINKTVLEFKRTHQDRWSEFKESFSSEQLDALINASQVSYCS